MISSVLVRVTESTTILNGNEPWCPFPEYDYDHEEAGEEVWQYIADRVSYSCDQDQGMEYFV